MHLFAAGMFFSVWKLQTGYLEKIPGLTLCFLCEISCVLSFLCYNKVLFENGYCSQAMFREVFWGIKLVEK